MGQGEVAVKRVMARTLEGWTGFGGNQMNMLVVRVLRRGETPGIKNLLASAATRWRLWGRSRLAADRSYK